MNELFNRVDWKSVKIFLVAAALASSYFLGSDLIKRLENVEEMQYLMYQAMSGQRN